MLLKHRLASRFLPGREREAIVYTPPSYDDSRTLRCPVLYLHDGQNLFDPATAYCNQDWKLGCVLDDLVAAGQIAPLIAVGIYHAGERRPCEYTHVRSVSGDGGGARLHGRFLLEELKPLIDREYRTLDGPAETGLGGSSLGGLATFYLGTRFPHVFGKLIVMSPSVWWAGRAILTYARKRRATLGQRIWLDVGTCEGSQPETCVSDVRALRDVLTARGWQLGQNLQYLEDLGGAHNEKAWESRMRRALPFLFAPSAISTSEQVA